MAAATKSVAVHANSAGAVHVGSDESARWLEIGQERSSLAHRLEIIDVELHPGFASDRQQVQHGIG